MNVPPATPRPTRRGLLAPHHRPKLLAGIVALSTLLLVHCVTSPRSAQGRLCVAGQFVPIDAPVVLWNDPGGYDAHKPGKWFVDEPPDGKLRYTPLRGSLPQAIAQNVGADGLTLAQLQQVVHQFVLHFDVCGTSRQCFKVLQDVRSLSVHFLLDVDGTIYQTLDLRHKAHHATTANDVSVGVEIAHPGTFPQPLSADMRRWYERDEQGWRMKFPAWMQETGVRTPGFIPRPDRPEMIEGRIHGKQYWQFDYTPQQYRSLAALCAALSRTFPRIKLEAPRDATGAVRSDQLSDAELRTFDGIIGHHHVQQNKTDPGPALQWERLLKDARALR